MTPEDIQRMPLKTLQDTCLSLSRDYQVLQQELATLKRMIFGTKSERYLPLKDEANQQSLFSESRESVKEAASEKVLSYTRNKKGEKGHGRQVLPSHLPREEVTVGRKNYLFAGSHDGAKRLALFYTLVNNAKSAGLNPETYLREVISRIASYPYHKLDDLLPQNIILTQ